jgi:hypothetical protein
MGRDCSTNFGKGIYIYIYRVLVGNPQGKRPLRRPRRRWVVNI